MTQTEPRTRVILVAIDASPHSLAALETAARVASRLHAELHGMYVEDINLLRTAELPFASAIGASGKPHPLTVDALERELRRQAEIARRAVEAAGARSHVVCSFAVARGTVLEEIVRAATAAEIVTVGRTGWSRRGTRLGSVTRSLLEEGTASLLMVEKNDVEGPLAVVFDGSPAAHRAMALAAALTADQPSPITVLLAGKSAQKPEDAIRELKQAGVPMRVEMPAGDSAEALSESLRRLPVKTVLVPESVFSERTQAARLAEQLSRCVFLVR
jgi:nucleotide-binding universal stress UspA family protein